MNLDTMLAWGQDVQEIVGPPWGPLVSNVSGTVRANLGRIQNDIPAPAAFLNEALPVVQKHLPALQAFWVDIKPVLDRGLNPALVSVNDLMPILSKIAADLHAAFPEKKS